MQARPSGVSDRELTIVLLGNHFHREMLADVANRELVVQAVRRCVAGAERVNLVAGGEAERIHHCLDELEKDRAAAVRGAYLKGESYAELAERHGVRFGAEAAAEY